MKPSVILSALAVSASLVASVHAAVVSAGNVVVLRVGDGSAALTNASTAGFLDEFARTGGAAVQSVGLPTGGSPLTFSGTATSEGQITLNNGYLGVGGYATGTGTAGVASTASNVVARAYSGYKLSNDLAGTPAVGGTTTTQYSTNNLRSVTTDGTNAYGAGGNSGTVLLPSTVVQSAIANTRVVNAFNGNLYFSTASGTSRGIYAFAGASTAAATPTLLISTGATSSAYDFSFSPDGRTAYVADDTAVTGGVQKYTSTDGFTFALAYTISLDGDGAATAQTAGARGLGVDYSTLGGPTIFATSTEAANRLVSFKDTGAAATITTLATAATNTAFRGVIVTAVPEPTAVAGLGALAALGLRRRR